jgi:hypothetical protein
MNWVLISHKTTFFTVTAVETSDLTTTEYWLDFLYEKVNPVLAKMSTWLRGSYDSVL